MANKDDAGNEYSGEFSKQFYKISEVADFVGVPLSTLRYWELQFPEAVEPIRNSGKIRYYTPATIETLRLIRYLLHDRGMKIEAARKELRHNRSNLSRRMKILSKLSAVRSELKLLLSSLEKRRDIDSHQ